MQPMVEQGENLVKIELGEAMHLTVVGRFERWSYQTLCEMLEPHGVTTSKQVVRRTTCLLRGRGEHGALVDAMVRGIPIIDEMQMVRLFEVGAIELGDLGERAWGEVSRFGEVRALLHDARPDGATWLALCELLDRCAAEEARVLVPYARDFFDSWEAQGLLDGVRYPTSCEITDAVSWADAKNTGFEGELCVAPLSWVSELIRGEEHEKFTLIRGLDFTHTGLKGGVIKKILDNPHLHRVRRISLPITKPITRPLVQQLCSKPWLDRLVTLRIGGYTRFVDDMFAAFGKTPGALRELDVSQAPYFVPWRTHCAPYFHGLDTLSMNCQHIRDHHLELWLEFFHHAFEGHLALLDVGSMHESLAENLEDPLFVEAVCEPLNALLCQCELLERVDTLGLGLMYDLIDVEKVRASHPSLEVRR